MEGATRADLEHAPAARLEGKAALVVGGTSGIGRAIALRFAAEGASVVIASRTRASNEGPASTDELIRERGGVGEYVELDVTDPAGVGSAFARAIESLRRWTSTGLTKCAANPASALLALSDSAP